MEAEQQGLIENLNGLVKTISPHFKSTDNKLKRRHQQISSYDNYCFECQNTNITFSSKPENTNLTDTKFYLCDDCYHIFCLPCLQEKYRFLLKSKIYCPYCHYSSNVNNLKFDFCDEKLTCVQNFLSNRVSELETEISSKFENLEIPSDYESGPSDDDEKTLVGSDSGQGMLLPSDLAEAMASSSSAGSDPSSSRRSSVEIPEIETARTGPENYAVTLPNTDSLITPVANPGDDSDDDTHTSGVSSSNLPSNDPVHTLSLGIGDSCDLLAGFLNSIPSDQMKIDSKSNKSVKEFFNKPTINKIIQPRNKMMMPKEIESIDLISSDESRSNTPEPSLPQPTPVPFSAPNTAPVQAGANAPVNAANVNLEKKLTLTGKFRIKQKIRPVQSKATPVNNSQQNQTIVNSQPKMPEKKSITEPVKPQQLAEQLPVETRIPSPIDVISSDMSDISESPPKSRNPSTESDAQVKINEAEKEKVQPQIVSSMDNDMEESDTESLPSRIEDLNHRLHSQFDHLRWIWGNLNFVQAAFEGFLGALWGLFGGFWGGGAF